MRSPRQLFEEHKGYSLSKWSVYLEAYDDHFHKYRGKEITLLEIGINHGSSIELWRKFFGANARIIGVDIFDECKKLNLDAEVFIGSQSNRAFLRDLKTKIPKLDILIDDGGHTMRQQIITFEELYDHVKEDGYYVCEDLHTSYWRKYGGGYKRAGSFIEMSKGLIDQLNARHSRQAQFKEDDFSKTAFSLHFYDSLLLIKKGKFKNEQLFGGEEKPHEGYHKKKRKLLSWVVSLVDKVFIKLRLRDPFRR